MILLFHRAIKFCERRKFIAFSKQNFYPIKHSHKKMIYVYYVKNLKLIVHEMHSIA